MGMHPGCPLPHRLPPPPLVMPNRHGVSGDLEGTQGMWSRRGHKGIFPRIRIMPILPRREGGGMVACLGRGSPPEPMKNIWEGAPPAFHPVPPNVLFLHGDSTWESPSHTHNGDETPSCH